jgi:hypothetical protein
MTADGDLHQRFGAWLLRGSPGSPPRDAALHASACPQCQMLVAAQDALSEIDVGLSPPPASPAVRLRHTPAVRVTRVATAVGAAVLLSVGGVAAAQLLANANGGSVATAPDPSNGSPSPDQAVMGDGDTRNSSPAVDPRLTTERDPTPDETDEATESPLPSDEPTPVAPPPTAPVTPAPSPTPLATAQQSTSTPSPTSAPTPRPTQTPSPTPAPPSPTPAPPSPTPTPPSPTPTPTPTPDPTPTPPSPTPTPAPTPTPPSPTPTPSPTPPSPTPTPTP